MAKKETTELSDYERQRQENIAQRDKLLKQLALDASSAGLGPGQKPKPAKPTSTHRKKPVVKKVKEEIVPRRTSSRIAGIEADSEVAKRKAEDEYVAVQEAARVKRQRISGPLDLSEIQVAGKGWDKNENFLQSVVDVVSRGANPYKRTFGEEEVKETTNKELRALREKMSGLELYDGFEPNRIKITPERIYSLGFHPVTEKPLVFAGDKLGNLGIFDASRPSDSKNLEPVKIENQDEEEAEDSPNPNITSFHLHTRTISSFQFSPHNPSHLYTSSYDSSVRLLDLTKSSTTEIYSPTDSSLDEPISGVEMDPLSPHLLYFSRLDGHIGRSDTRAPNTVDIFKLSEKKIGGFSLNPSCPHFIATASLDRTMRIWDLRKLSGKKGAQLPALCGEHESRLSVSHAAFNSAGQVATASYDDTVKIHTFEGMSSWTAGVDLTEKEMAPSAIIRHNNQTGRWVTILRAQWQLHPSDNVQRFCIGNMNRFVDVYTSKGEQLAQLGGDGITAVPAVAQFHPTNDWVAAGTASGKLCLWMKVRIVQSDRIPDAIPFEEDTDARGNDDQIRHLDEESSADDLFATSSADSPSRPLRNSTITTTEKAIFERIFKEISDDASKKAAQEDNPLENSFEEDEPLHGDAYSDLNAIFDRAIWKTERAIQQSPRAGADRKHPDQFSRNFITALDAVGATHKAHRIAIARIGEIDKNIQASVAENNRRVMKKISEAKTDMEIWNVLETDVFTLIKQYESQRKDREEQDKPKKRKRGGSLSKADVEAAAAKEKKQSLQAREKSFQQAETEAILSSNYGDYCLAVMRTLRRTYPASPYLMNLLPTIKRLGPISHVLAGSVDLYNEILFLLWSQYSDLHGMADLITEMGNQGIESNEITLRILKMVNSARSRAYREETPMKLWWELSPVDAGWTRVRKIADKVYVEIQQAKTRRAMEGDMASGRDVEGEMEVETVRSQEETSEDELRVKRAIADGATVMNGGLNVLA
ncbi:MAG: hypothetical protein Q9172_000083 [Xanthocarpia lactea]